MSAIYVVAPQPVQHRLNTIRGWADGTRSLTCLCEYPTDPTADPAEAYDEFIWHIANKNREAEKDANAARPMAELMTAIVSQFSGGLPMFTNATFVSDGDIILTFANSADVHWWVLALDAERTIYRTQVAGGRHVSARVRFMGWDVELAADETTVAATTAPDPADDTVTLTPEGDKVLVATAALLPDAPELPADPIADAVRAQVLDAPERISDERVAEIVAELNRLAAAKDGADDAYIDALPELDRDSVRGVRGGGMGGYYRVGLTDGTVLDFEVHGAECAWVVAWR